MTGEFMRDLLSKGEKMVQPITKTVSFSSPPLLTFGSYHYNIYFFSSPVVLQ